MERITPPISYAFPNRNSRALLSGSYAAIWNLDRTPYATWGTGSTGSMLMMGDLLLSPFSQTSASRRNRPSPLLLRK